MFPALTHLWPGVIFRDGCGSGANLGNPDGPATGSFSSAEGMQERRGSISKQIHCNKTPTVVAVIVKMHAQSRCGFRHCVHGNHDLIGIGGCRNGHFLLPDDGLTYPDANMGKGRFRKVEGVVPDQNTESVTWLHGDWKGLIKRAIVTDSGLDFEGAPLGAPCR